MIVTNVVGAFDVESIEEFDDHRGLCPKRPVGVRGRLGVTESEQVWYEASIVRREPRDDLAPDVGRERASVEEQQGLIVPLLVVSNAYLTNP